MSKQVQSYVQKLAKLIEKDGPASVATRLGEWDTVSIKRWVKVGAIPRTQVNKVKALFMKGEK